VNTKKTSLSYCGDLVRSVDADRFLLSMFVQADRREDLWALLAFNYEISKTRDVVSESTLGLIRLQWWRDSIASIYDQGDVPEHEVLKPLAVAVKKYNLPREHFDKLIYAREFDLEDVLPGNVEGLMNYADFTTTPLLALAVQVCGGDPEQEVLQPIAMNYTVAKVLRSTAVYAQGGRCLLPEDLLVKYDVSRENFLEDDVREALKPLIEEIVGYKLPVSPSSFPFIRGSAALSEMYFKHLSACDFDVFSVRFLNEPPFKALKLFWKIKCCF